MKKIRVLILAYFFKPYSKNFAIFYKKISPIINIFKFIYSLRIVLLLITIWRFHGFIYTLTYFVLVIILGFDILDFLNMLGFIYSNFITLFVEFKSNIINRLYNLFHIKSIENVIQVVEKQVEESKINRVNIGNSTTSKPISVKVDVVEPIRYKYVTNPKPKIIDHSFSLTDIITSKYFYIPAIIILSCYGITYHNEIFTSVSTQVSVVSNTILDWYHWFFGRGPNDGTSDLLNNTQNLVNVVSNNSPNFSRPNTPIIDSIVVEEN
jgi:hypothetical protein